MAAGLYARVSVKHENRKDMTIENQMLLMKRYIEKHHISYGDSYKDVGYSGMNFNRPQFQRLMADIRQGIIDTVIVKDFSRLGRNYIETGEYMEHIFPLYGVRLISVSEHYDSEDNSSGIFYTGIKNIMNEWYAKENGRKVAFVKERQRKKGGYTGGVTPYGYKAVIKNGLRILTEDESMNILKEIYRKRECGYHSEEIAVWLNQSGVNTPAVYHKTGELYAKNKNVYKKWDSGSVRRLWNKVSNTCGDNHTA